MKKFVVPVLGLFFAISFTNNSFAVETNKEWFQQARQKCDPAKPITGKIEVETAVDGDTVFIKTSSGSYSVRMMNIDTPETHFEGQSQGKWGEVAADRLKEILPTGTQVRLEYGSDMCDKYGRVLGQIFVGKMHANKQMVKEGLAVNYCYFPATEYCEEFGKLAEAAIAKRIGMFSDSNVELPYDFRRRIAGRKGTSYVGNIFTKEVVGPELQERVPVGARVFFPRADMIQAPYHLVR